MVGGGTATQWYYIRSHCLGDACIDIDDIYISLKAHFLFPVPDVEICANLIVNGEYNLTRLLPIILNDWVTLVSIYRSIVRWSMV